jgi:hypothetical protein
MRAAGLLPGVMVECSGRDVLVWVNEHQFSESGRDIICLARSRGRRLVSDF